MFFYFSSTWPKIEISQILVTNDSYRNDPSHDGHDAYSGRRSRDSVEEVI